VFAHLESGEETEAYVGDERPWLMLGLRGVPPDERARFIRLALLEAYLDPVSGDPLAWQALLPPWRRRVSTTALRSCGHGRSRSSSGLV
jgi:hypothetical protein